MIGHVYLSVGNISQAKDFYVDALGFEVTLNWGGTALFVSAGGYHHHMAMNTWRSKGAGKRQLALGLGKVEIKLDTTDELLATKERLAFYKQEVRNDEHRFSVEDPWGNLITLETKEGTK